MGWFAFGLRARLQRAFFERIAPKKAKAEAVDLQKELAAKGLDSLFPPCSWPSVNVVSSRTFWVVVHELKLLHVNVRRASWPQRFVGTRTAGRVCRGCTWISKSPSVPKSFV